ALRPLPAAAGLLLGVQPDSRCERGAAAQTSAADARAPAVPVRLADTVLRVRPGGGRPGRRDGRDAAARHRPQARRALKFREHFPLDVNRSSREMLLRVPGLGVRAVDSVVASRRHRRLRLDDVARLTGSIARVRPFIVAADWRPTLLTDRADLRALLAPRSEQLELFAA